MPIRIFTLALALAAALTAGPAAALDGEIVITQAKAQAGNVTPGDNPGFPVTLSGAFTSYRLGSSLAPAAGRDAIVINADNVTLNLNGFALNGSRVARYGIYSTATTATILNGTITGFAQNAIQTGEQGRYWTLRDLRIVDNGYGVSLGNYSHVIGNTIAGNRGIGVGCGDCQIERNVIAGNTGSAIYMTGGSVLGNTLVKNGGSGLVASGASPHIVGYGNNVINGNNNGGDQVFRTTGLKQLHVNACSTAC